MLTFQRNSCARSSGLVNKYSVLRCTVVKILAILSTLDMSKPFGATPAIWQLLKGFYEEGNELFVIPYHGRGIDSIWWKSYGNPNYYKGLILESLLKLRGNQKKSESSSILPLIAQRFAKPKLEKLALGIIQENNIDAVLLIGVPLNQLTGLATNLKKQRQIPIIYYDLDVPTSLPSHGGFTFNYYTGADLSEYDSIVVPSEGTVNELREMGARDINIVHFGVDPDVYTPINIEKDIDFFFFGNGGRARVNNIRMMIAEPSRQLSKNFVVSGRDLNIDLGSARIMKPLSFVEWRQYSCRAKVNLNVVRELHAKTYATSTSRPFELAAMQCCIVSAPYRGLEKWFDIGKEIIMVNSKEECLEVYQMLMEDDEYRLRMGEAAHARVLREHTVRHRARQLTEVIKKYN